MVSASLRDRVKLVSREKVGIIRSLGWREATRGAWSASLAVQPRVR